MSITAIRPARRLLSCISQSYSTAISWPCLHHNPFIKAPTSSSIPQSSMLRPFPTVRSFTTSRTEHNDPVRTSRPENVLPSAPLPSESASARSPLNARFQARMDELVTRLARASQQVNEYTGTDYTGISALRDSIKDQEQAVRTAHDALRGAKEAHDTAVAAQASSQKEIVQLLERKSSWSGPDLERYMALVRREHVNEQDVAGTRTALEDKERGLEATRQALERLERKQYHEEQVWSDTIRRNSTWVTFGLMGFNILLLLANVVIIEPWRRRRLVREVKDVLGANAELEAARVADGHVDERPVESAVEAPTEESEVQAVPVAAASAEEALIVTEVGEVESAIKSHEVEKTIDGAVQGQFGGRAQQAYNSALGYVRYVEELVRLLLSDHTLTIRRIDLTQSVVTGMAFGAWITYVWMSLLGVRVL